MDIVILGFIVIALIISFTEYKLHSDARYRSGYNDGWVDCHKAHKQFEMSLDDELVLHIMKKAIKSYLRNKKYVDKEALESIEDVIDFAEFKHIVHYLAVYRKENIERE